MAAGQQIAFEPALAHVLAEHFHDAAVAREMLVGRQDLGLHSRSVASNTASSRLEAVSSGPNTRKLRAPRSASSRRAESGPATRVASAIDAARRSAPSTA